MKFEETDTVELIESLNETIEKEIVAFLNTNGGTIYIGVKDNGEIIGVNNTDDMMKKISDTITQKLLPNPQEIVDLCSKYIEGKYIVQIDVKKGNALYYIKRYGRSAAGCYVRVGSTYRSMTEEQIEKYYSLSVSSNNDIIISIKARYTPITFEQLKIYYTEKGFHLNDESMLENLSLINEKGEYNKLAELMSDKNRISIIFARFHGFDKVSFAEKMDYGNQCIITAIQRIMSRLEVENYTSSTITTGKRIDKRLVDMDCLKEIVYNMITHHDWASGLTLAIYMFDDRFEIISHGGLPFGQTIDNFYRGISKPRSAALMRIMKDLDIVESTGHGIPKVVRIYGKNVFEITDSFINVVIPFDKEVMASKNSKNDVYDTENIVGTENDTENSNVGTENIETLEKKIIAIIRLNPKTTQNKMAELVGVSRRTISRVLNNSKNIKHVGPDKGGHWEIIDNDN